MTRVILRSIAVLLLALLVLPFAWTTASGDRFVTVSSGSMAPTFQVGDVLSVQRPTGHELRHVGEIVVASLDLGSDRSEYVHRVEALTKDGAWLRGDANASRDPQPITQDQVVGTPRFALSGPTAGAFTYLQGIEGRLTVSALALVLFFIPVKRRPRPEPRTDGAETGSEERSLA